MKNKKRECIKKEKKTEYNWLEIGPLSSQYTRADYNYEEVLICSNGFRLCRTSTTSSGLNGKWLLYSPLDRFLKRTNTCKNPFDWANSIINKEMK